MKAPWEENASAIWLCVLEGEEVQEILACGQPDPVCVPSQAGGLVFTSDFSNENYSHGMQNAQEKSQPELLLPQQELNFHIPTRML